jgi:O-acetyl-ADP-ribose deacetylase (regulator of RNase III)
MWAGSRSRSLVSKELLGEIAVRIIHKKGDLLEAPQAILAHGVNSLGVMGAGVAKAIRERFPAAYGAYREKYQADGWQTGEVQFVAVPGPDRDRWVANCCMQEKIGAGRDQNDYRAYYSIFTKLINFAIDTKEYQFAIPRIGAGLANGDFERIIQILLECGRNKGTIDYITKTTKEVAVYVYSLN